MPDGHPPLRGLLSVRLVGDHIPVSGLVLVSDKLDGGEFTETDEAVLAQLAAMASLGLQQIQATILAERRADELRGILRSVPGAVFVAHDARCREVTGSLGAYEIFGLSPENHIGAGVRQKLCPRLIRLKHGGRDLSPREMPIRKAAEEGIEIRNYEMEVVYRDGTSRWLYGSAVPLFDEKGKPRGSVGAFVDITERKRFSQELEQRVAKRTAQVEEAYAKLAKKEAEVRMISRKVLEAAEHERKSVARDLHDALGSNLSAAKLYLERGLQETFGANPPEWATVAAELVKDSIEDVRRISSNLWPAALDELGLAAAISTVLDKAAAAGGFSVEKHFDLASEDLVPDISMAVYRIAQEVANNAVKHSKASLLKFSLVREGEGLRLSASDDGQGFDLDEIRMRSRAEEKRLGLLGMTERARLTGGWLQVLSAPGQGTTVNAFWPRAMRW
ncbi:MAG: PAS domain S-box protein [Deltaproteobacteria bacterium]|nr:PAS domain S-box protein [Deltaproteobacteria bacterium]